MNEDWDQRVLGWRAACSRHRMAIAMGLAVLAGPCTVFIGHSMGISSSICIGLACEAGAVIGVLVHLAFPRSDQETL